jgi:hypothetical protein
MHHRKNHNFVRIYTIKNAKWETPNQPSPDITSDGLSRFRISLKPLYGMLYFTKKLGAEIWYL